MKKQRVKGSGRKPLYNEDTTTITCRVPVSKKQEVKDLINLQLKMYQVTKPKLT